MDELIKQGQWWWLLVPLGTGVFALVGSWLGAKLGQKTEHKQWLRNEKQKEYVAAIAATTSILEAVRLMVLDQSATLELEPSTYIPPIDVLAPHKVKVTLREFLVGIHECIDVLQDLNSSDRMDRARLRFEALAEKHATLLKQIREDLGVKDR